MTRRRRGGLWLGRHQGRLSRRGAKPGLGQAGGSGPWRETELAGAYLRGWTAQSPVLGLRGLGLDEGCPEVRVDGKRAARGIRSLQLPPISLLHPGTWPFMEPAILLSLGEKPASLYRPLDQPTEKQVLEIRGFKTNKLPYRLKRGKGWPFFSFPPLLSLSLSLFLLSFHLSLPLAFPLVPPLSFLSFFFCLY